MKEIKKGARFFETRVMSSRQLTMKIWWS